MKLFYYYFLFILLILNACNKEEAPDFLQSTGAMTEEIRVLQSFNSLSISDNIILSIVQDTCNWARVSAGKNLMPEIYTKVENGHLSIYNDNSYNWVRSYKPKVIIVLGVKKLNYINYLGYEDITCLNTLTTDSFYFETKIGVGHLDFDINCNYSSFKIHAGTSDLTIKGTANSNYIYSFGYGPVEAVNYICDNNAVHLKNLASARINVNNDLNATIENKGNIYYKGNPSQVKTNITGKGQLIKLD